MADDESTLTDNEVGNSVSEVHKLAVIKAWQVISNLPNKSAIDWSSSAEDRNMSRIVEQQGQDQNKAAYCYIREFLDPEWPFDVAATSSIKRNLVKWLKVSFTRHFVVHPAAYY